MYSVPFASTAPELAGAAAPVGSAAVNNASRLSLARSLNNSDGAGSVAVSFALNAVAKLG